MNISSDVLNNSIKVIVAFILFVLTMLLHNMVDQYEISGDELLANGDFNNNLDGWKKSGDVTVVLSDSHTVVRLKSENNQKIVSIKQTLENIKKGQTVRLFGALKIKDVSKGDKVWQAARIVFVAESPEGQLMYNVPHVLVMQNGTIDWKLYSKIFVAVSHAARYYVEIQLVNVRGVLWVKDLSLRPVKEALSYKVLQSVLVMLWLLAVFWMLAPYWRNIISSKRNVLILSMLMVAVFSSLASVDLKHGFIEFLKHPLPWVEDEAMLFRVGHFLTYSLISVAVFWKMKSRRTIVICLGLLVMFSMATEILQFLVGGRTPRVSDFLIDVSGVVIGLLVSYILLPSMRVSLKQEVK